MTAFMSYESYLSLSPEERAARQEAIHKFNRIIDNCGPVQDACERDDWSWVSGWLFGQFGVVVSPEWCASECSNAKKIACWSDGSWRLWWKTRLIAAGKFPSPQSPVGCGRLTTEIHVGFLSIIETEEELAQLADWRKEKIESGPSTPAIERVQTNPEPIDRVALRVVGWRDE